LPLCDWIYIESIGNSGVLTRKIINRSKDIGKHLWRIVQLTMEKDCMPFATQVAYQIVFLLAPGMLVLTGLLSLLGSDPQTLRGIIDLLKAFLPAGLHGLINQQAGALVVLGGAGTVMSIGFLIGFWLGMSLIATMTRALNTIHSAPQRQQPLSRYLISALLLFWFVVIILGSFNLLLFGERLAGAAEAVFHLQLPWAAIISFLKIPAIIAALVFLAMAVYLMSPDIHQRWRDVFPGALFFAVVWVAFTFIFKIYVENFASYAQIYLALAGFIILMFWAYVTSLCFLLGAVVNEYLRRLKLGIVDFPLALPESASPENPETAQPAA